MNLSLFVKGLLHTVGQDLGLVRTAQPQPGIDLEALLAYKPTSQQDAFDHLHKLNDALGQVAPNDEKSIGRIFIEIGTIVETFFTNFQQEGAFLIAVGTALENGLARLARSGSAASASRSPSRALAIAVPPIGTT